LSPIDHILELLKDGKWHEIKQIAEKAQLHEFKLELITSFLFEYGFIKIDTKKKKIRLAPALLSFMKKTQGIENETAKH